MFNNFGATTAEILSRFALSGYTPSLDDFGGSAEIQSTLDDAVREVVQAMPATLRDAIQRPDLMRLESRAADGQTGLTLKISPAVAGKTHVWVGQPGQFVSRPVLVTNPWDRGVILTGMNFINPTPPGAVVELAEDQFSITGDAITLVTGMQRNAMAFASYEVDVEDEDFAMESLADLAVTGAAATLGSKVYPQASNEWPYVQRLIASWSDGLEGLANGEWIPAELRVIQWWKAPEPDAAEGRLSSVRRYRA